MNDESLSERLRTDAGYGHSEYNRPLLLEAADYIDAHMPHARGDAAKTWVTDSVRGLFEAAGPSVTVSDVIEFMTAGSPRHQLALCSMANDFATSDFIALLTICDLVGTDTEVGMLL